MSPAMINIVVTVAISLVSASFDQRTSLKTRRRPTVKLSTKNNAVPSKVRARAAASTVP